MTKRNKIRSGGCDYELGDIGGHKKNQATSVSSGPFPRGIIICKDFAFFYGGRRCPAGGVVEKMKNNEISALSFSPNPTKHPARVKKKQENRKGGRNSGALLEAFVW